MGNNGFLQTAMAWFGFAWHQFERVLSYPLISTQRVYFLYVVAAIGFALLVYLRTRRESSGTHTSPGLKDFATFLFPRSVWSQPSAWLDVRYFFFHNFIWIGMFASLGIAVTQWSVVSVSDFLLGLNDGQAVFYTEHYFLGGIVYMFVLLAAIDFTAFLIHYAQHKVSWLWAFHKVHHSATVLHPLTNYREHPIDNLLYVVGTAWVTGAVGGLSNFLFGGTFRMPTIIGLSVLAFAFNFLAYNLRHSHIWLRWPGKLNYLFGCPAHHQVHHSCHPEHIDKNMAFMFPVWDLLFGTYCLPETNKDVKFGLGNGEEKDFNSCLGLYLVPFLKLWRKSRGLAPARPAPPS
ncbi:MAG: sterol desaturase family protein [Xanthomonadales bacterium]|nr:sterol desaturase family protein [Xanthomonadales bacterium]